MKISYYDLRDIYENEIVKNVKNKKKINDFEKKKTLYLFSLKREVENNTYEPKHFHLFLIKDPKTRLIMSQNLYDKVFNHYFTRHVLEPKLTHRLAYFNVATRKGMGLSYGVDILLKDIEKNKKYGTFYFLKMDIKKYFYNIDHEVLKSLVIDYLDSSEYKYFLKILDSTNKAYINDFINKKNLSDIPTYKWGKGLPIGLQSSQFLAIFYLHRLHHYIVHDLHIKHIVVYMDDYVLIHPNKEYLKERLNKIEKQLKEIYRLELNQKKTMITSSKEGVVFLGYKFRVINNKTIVTLTNQNKCKLRKTIKKCKYEYEIDEDFHKAFSRINNIKYGRKYINKKFINETLNKLWYN